MAGITMFHLEKEDKGIYLVGTNIRDLFKICNNMEERNVIFEGILSEMLKLLRMVDKQNFPKEEFFSLFQKWRSITNGEKIVFLNVHLKTFM